MCTRSADLGPKRKLLCSTDRQASRRKKRPPQNAVVRERKTLPKKKSSWGRRKASERVSKRKKKSLVGRRQGSERERSLNEAKTKLVRMAKKQRKEPEVERERGKREKSRLQWRQQKPACVSANSSTVTVLTAR